MNAQTEQMIETLKKAECFTCKGYMNELKIKFEGYYYSFCAEKNVEYNKDIFGAIVNRFYNTHNDYCKELYQEFVYRMIARLNKMGVSKEELLKINEEAITDQNLINN